jgi:outer membrane lipoprotein carrier protein
MLTLLVWLAVAPVTPVALPPKAPPGKLAVGAIVEKMQKNYDQAKDYRARFSQKYTNLAFNRTKVSTGVVSFKKPGKMRWDYDQPEKKMFLSTGKVLWLYEPEDKQAFRQELKQSQLPAALSFLLGKGKLADEFEISLVTDIPYGRAEDYRLSLKPKQPQATYKSIYFIVDPGSFFVSESVLVNAAGDVNDISFSDLKVNTRLTDADFNWTKPADVKVIDTAKLTK